MEKVTIDKIIDTMKIWVEDKHPITPVQWLDASMKINALISDEDEKYLRYEQEAIRIKLDYKVKEDCSNALADSYMRTTPQYLQWKKQEAKLKQIQEFIRLAKKFASLKETEYFGT